MSALADLDPGQAADAVLDGHDTDWVHDFVRQLDRRLTGHELERIARVWDLSRADLGGLFGVSRQAVTKWIDGGIPAARAEQVADVTAITDLLVRYLKRSRVPAVVRRPADRLGGASMIELASSGRSSEALRLTRQMFTFADAHA